jgi:hypothetical protein
VDYWDVFVDSFTSIAEANVPTIAIAANLAKMDEDPLKAGFGIIGTYTPALGIAQSISEAFSTKPNVDGAGGTPVLAAALAVLEDMQEQCGEGSPDRGADFLDGASLFRGVADKLSTAGPPESWQGAGADAYRQANHRQYLRADTMKQADEKVQEAIAAEASDVLDTRQVLNDAVVFLNSCIPIATVLGAAKMGTTASYAFQLQAVGKVMPGAVSRFSELSTAVDGYAAQVADAASIYENVQVENPGKTADIGDRLHVVPADLRIRSGEQQAIATDILSARGTTTDTAANVTSTHGSVCQNTSTAVDAAVRNRTASADFMNRESTRLAEGLQTAARYYERTDQQQSAKLMDTFEPPR